MSAATRTAGYPVHRVVEYRRKAHPNGVVVTDWTAACSATGTLVGAMARFGLAGSARRGELCRACFNGNAWHSPPGVHWPDPTEIN